VWKRTGALFFSCRGTGDGREGKLTIRQGREGEGEGKEDGKRTGIELRKEREEKGKGLRGESERKPVRNNTTATTRLDPAY
jgi:hypothetical protein